MCTSSLVARRRPDPTREIDAFDSFQRRHADTELCVSSTSCRRAGFGSGAKTLKTPVDLFAGLRTRARIVNLGDFQQSVPWMTIPTAAGGGTVAHCGHHDRAARRAPADATAESFAFCARDSSGCCSGSAGETSFKSPAVKPATPFALARSSIAPFNQSRPPVTMRAALDIPGNCRHSRHSCSCCSCARLFLFCMSYPSHEGEYRITHVIVPASRSPPFTVLCGPLRCDEEYRSLRTVGRVRGDDSERTQASPPPRAFFPLRVSPSAWHVSTLYRCCYMLELPDRIHLIFLHAVAWY